MTAGEEKKIETLKMFMEHLNHLKEFAKYLMIHSHDGIESKYG